MIQVIHRAFDILEFIAKEPEKPKTLSEIAGSLQLNAGTCANIIKTMIERRYIDKIEKKGYVLGANAYNIGGGDSYKRKLLEVAREEMELLTHVLDENSELTVLQNNLRIVLLRVSSNHDLQVRAASERIAYDTASGRIMIAFLPETALEKYVEKYGLPTVEEWREATTEKNLKREIGKIKADGYAIRTTKEQIFGIAVPIFVNDKTVAGLGVYMPEFRYEKYDKKKIIERIIQSGKKINEKLISER
jgi:DNA-binding IclR family transcriptional regulator